MSVNKLSELSISTHLPLLLLHVEHVLNEAGCSSEGRLLFKIEIFCHIFAFPVLVGVRSRRPCMDRCEKVIKRLLNINFTIELKRTTQVSQLEKLTPDRSWVVNLKGTGDLLRFNFFVEVLEGVDERFEG